MSRASSPLRDAMIFVVGARRSGTNWLQRILAAHPAVAAIPSETYLFSRGIKQLAERFHHGVLGSPGTSFVYMDREDMLDALRDLCDRVFLPFLRAAPGATRLVERTPEHGTAVDTIGAVYPDAHIVHIIRDGRDVARSLLSMGWESAPKTLEDAALEWRTSVESADAAGAPLDRYHAFFYERMLADPTAEVTALYERLGLDASAPVVEAALAEAGVRYNQDLNAPAIEAGKWRATYSDEDLATFMRVAGASLARLGYDTAAMPAPREQEPRGRPDRAVVSRRTANREILRRVREGQRRLDEVVAAINTGRPERITPMTAKAVSVRFVSPDRQWKGRGSEAWERLLDELRTDPAVRGRQVAGELYTGVPTLTAVMTFEDGTGGRDLRIVLVSVEGERITGFTYHQIPVRS